MLASRHSQEMYNYQEIKGLLEDMSTEMKALVDKVRVQLMTAWSAAAMHIGAMEGSEPCADGDLPSAPHAGQLRRGMPP